MLTWLVGAVMVFMAMLTPASSAYVPTIPGTEACVEFSTESDYTSSWSFEDCVNTWNAWTTSLPGASAKAYDHLDVLRTTVRELRQKNATCFLQAENSGDGAGSSFLRSITTWILAQAIGCEWVTPVWGRPIVTDNGSVLYCHEKKKRKKSDEAENMLIDVAKEYHVSCTIVDWLLFFRIQEESMELPSTGRFKHWELAAWEKRGFPAELLQEVQDTDYDNRDWDHLVINVGKSTGARHLIFQPSWSEFQRKAIRNSLRKYRDDFHDFHRSGLEMSSDCGFDNSRLNFAIHVRMGDREMLLQDGNSYLQTLNNFMDTVDATVRESDLPPLFHIFSETLDPCPDEQTGIFRELPAWPVEVDQVAACLNAETPTECPEMRAGLPYCNPIRPGRYKVQGRSLVLHNEDDPAKTLSCMISANGGVVMGCSTFGQTAGLLNVKGLRFFSNACEGRRTATHYKAQPPLAIAELGNMWVPMNGSWHDPVIMSETILKSGVDSLLRGRGLQKYPD